MKIYIYLLLMHFYNMLINVMLVETINAWSSDTSYS